MCIDDKSVFRGIHQEIFHVKDFDRDIKTYIYMLMRRVRQESKVPGLILGKFFPGGTILSGNKIVQQEAQFCLEREFQIFQNSST